MFKIPNYENPLPSYVNGPEKIILYVSKTNNLDKRIESRLSSLNFYPENYFENKIPLFTQKIRNGVAKAYEPKEDNLFLNVIRRLLKKDDLQVSYGQYVSYLIARGIQMAVLNNHLKNTKETLIFSTLNDDEIRFTVYPIVLDFVIKRMEQDIHL